MVKISEATVRRKRDRERNHSKKKPWAGWLKNPDRLERRDHSGALTNEKVQHMIDQIRNDDVYDRFGQKTSYSKLGVDSATGVDLNDLVKLRDIALISFNWIYFKRAREVLGLTFGSIGVAENALSETETYKVMTVSLNIEKKRKHYKICPKCKVKDQPLKKPQLELL